MKTKFIALVSLFATFGAMANDVNVNVNVTVDGITRNKNNSCSAKVVDLSGDMKLDAPDGAKRYSIVTPAFQYAIKPSDLQHDVTANGAMFTINNPGRYYISQDLVPKYENNGVSVISITADNVTLDLNGKAIRVHHASAAATGMTAIKLANGLKSVRIVNGDIVGANGGTFFTANGIDLGTSPKDVSLDDVHVSECNLQGLVCSGVNGLRMKNCSVTNCQATAASAGLKLTNSNDASVEDCWFNNNDTSVGDTHGIHLVNCVNCVVKNCNASSNTSTEAAAVTGHGIKLEDGTGACKNCVFENVVAINNASTGTGGLAVGLLLDSSTANCSFKNVDVSGNTGDAGATGLQATSAASCSFDDVKLSNNNATTSGQAAGVVLSACTDFTFNNIDASNNTSAAGAAYGFSLASACKGCNFVNCSTANNTVTSGNGIAAGFSVDASTGNVLTNCYAKNNTAVGSGQCSGFVFSGSSNGNKLTNCESLNNGNTGASTGNVYGFSVESSNGNQLVNCLANENSTSSTGTGNVAGMNFSASSGNTVKNCELNHNVSIAGNAYGMSLASSSGSNLVTDCNASINTATAADNVAAGFRASGGSANIFKNCNSIGNVCSGTGTISTTTIAQYACGFLLEASENASSVLSCRADHNNGGAGEGVGFGVFLAGDLDVAAGDANAPTNTTVKDCTMSFNTSSGSTGNTQGNKYGFFDNHSDTTSVLINNVSIGHGRSISTLDSSFDFVDPVNSSSSNGMNFMFFNSGIDENPMNMIHETDIFNWTTISTKTDWHNVSVVTGQLT